jgi:conjugative transposon TraK protein
MFTKFKNIDTAFRYLRTVCIAVVICYSFVVAWALSRSYSYTSSLQGRIYVLYNGKVLEAYAAERKDNIPVEARDHVSTFLHDFFTLDPDEKVISANMAKAFYLADGSAKRLYDNLKESGYFGNLIAGNISQEISIDSVSVDVNQYPYHFRAYATEQIIRATNTTTRSLVTHGYLRNVARSDHNSHGFLIERFEILENNDLKTTNR